MKGYLKINWNKRVLRARLHSNATTTGWWWLAGAFARSPFRRAVLDHSFNAETTRHVGGWGRLYGQPEIFHEPRPCFIRDGERERSPLRALMRAFFSPRKRAEYYTFLSNTCIEYAWIILMQITRNDDTDAVSEQILIMRELLLYSERKFCVSHFVCFIIQLSRSIMEIIERVGGKNITA